MFEVDVEGGFAGRILDVVVVEGAPEARVTCKGEFFSRGES